MRGRLALLVPLGLLALAAPASAAYHGTNGEVAFTSTQDGGARHIFVQNGSGIVDLTGAGSSAADTQPKFSPDGREIVFTRYAPGLPNTEIFVMSTDGSQHVQLTNTPQGNSDPTWSPDGTQIAFVSDRKNEVPQIFIMRSDGTAVHQITSDNSAKSELAWSPSGDRIAFVREVPGVGDREIYAINANESELTDLSNDPSHDDVEPAWSPDGSKIAYSGTFHPKGSVGGDLWTMNGDGSNQQPLDHENNGYSDGAYPAWSPDGTTIAFTANNGSGYYHVWEVAASGGQNSELVTNKVNGGNPVDEEVDWQPQPNGKALRTMITGAQVNKRKHTANFGFDAPGATKYRCEVQRGKRKAALKPCRSQATYKRLKPGKYTFKVIASGPGEQYTAARRRFKI